MQQNDFLLTSKCIWYFVGFCNYFCCKQWKFFFIIHKQFTHTANPATSRCYDNQSQALFQNSHKKQHLSKSKCQLKIYKYNYIHESKMKFKKSLFKYQIYFSLYKSYIAPPSLLWNKIFQNLFFVIVFVHEKLDHLGANINGVVLVTTDNKST